MKSVTSVDVRCCTCGTAFAMEEPLNEIRKSDGALFYCPNGHAQHFTESPVSKLSEANETIAELKEELRLVKEENTRLKCTRLNSAINEAPARGAKWVFWK